MGTEVVPTLKRFRKGTMPGNGPSGNDADQHGGENPDR